jgi:hypothetical protein
MKLIFFRSFNCKIIIKIYKKYVYYY